MAALALVLLVAAGLAAQHFWSGRTRTVSAPEIVRATGTYEAAGTMGSAAPARPPDTPTAAAQPGARPGALPVAGILVDVVGKVREPGVHQLPVGSRVADALRAAGGVRPGTRVDGLNRARFLVDGEQLHVGGPPAAGPDGPAGGPAAGAAAGAGTGAAAALAIPAVPVSLNTATAEQLDGLPGVGPVLAQHIIDYRTRRGGFRTVDELREVDGIGERRFADLRNLVRP